MHTSPAKRTDDFVNHQLRELPLSMKYKETETHFYMDFHSHVGYEIYYFQEGSGYFLIEDQIYPLEGQDLILVSPHESHKSSPKLQSPSTRSVLHFLPDLLDDRSRECLLEIFSLSLGQRHLRLSSERLHRFHYLLDRLHEEYAGRTGDALMAMRIYMSELLLELRRCWFSESVAERQAVDRRNVNPKVEQAVKYISNHFAENLTLQIIAGELFLNPYYLCHLFKKTLGITITEFMLQTRIHHARRLLMHTDMPVSEIAGKTGFNSFSYFGQTFKSLTGATPRDYRKKYRQLTME